MRKFHFILMAIFIALGSLTSVSATGNCKCDHACDEIIPSFENQVIECPQEINHATLVQYFRDSPEINRSVLTGFIGCGLKPFLGDHNGKTYTQKSFELAAVGTRTLICEIAEGIKDGKLFLYRIKVDPNFAQTADTCAWVYAVCHRLPDNSIVEPGYLVTVKCQRFTSPCVRFHFDRNFSIQLQGASLCELYKLLVLNQGNGSILIKGCRRYFSECGQPIPSPFVLNTEYQDFTHCATTAFPNRPIATSFTAAIITGFLKCEIVKEDDCSVCIRYYYDWDRRPDDICDLKEEDCREFVVEITKQKKTECEMVKKCVREKVEEGCTRIDDVIIHLQDEIDYLKASILDCLDDEEGDEFQV